MSENLRCIFFKCTDSVHFEEMPLITNNKEFVEKEITKRVKLGIAFGIITSLLFLALIFIFYNVYAIKELEDSCHVNPFEFENSPIIVINGSNEFIYPRHGEKLLTFVPQQHLEFVCPGRSIIIDQFKMNSSTFSGTCLSGNRFKMKGVEVNWMDLRCSDNPLSIIKYTGNNCKNNGKEIEVGFEIAKNRFLRSMLICFNQVLQVADYTYVKLPASINQRVLYTRRPQFRQGSDFYDIGTVNTLYIRKNQRATVNSLLGLPVTSTKYIQDNTDFFLSRGHLTANMDNFYAAQQNATFYYPNAAPQWQTFNGKNWNQIEIDVRDYAENNAVELDVWTGVHGVTTLPHETANKSVELYLYVNATSNRKALPVPEIYWKVVYNQETQRGVALIGVNNPYKTNKNIVQICEDVSQQLTWIRWEKNNQQQGFCYACSLEAFSKVITGLPNLIVKGLLL